MRNLSLICCYFLDKLNLSYLTQIKEQSSTNRLRFVIMPYVTCKLFFCFSSMLNITCNDSLADKLTLISYLTELMVFDDKVCEPSTTFNHINLSNSVKNEVCIVFFWYGGKRKKEYKVKKSW